MSNNADAAVKDALTNILNKPDHDIIDNNGISRVMIRSLLLDGPQADLDAASCIGAFAHKEHDIHRDDDVSNHHVKPSTTTSKLYHQLRGLPRRPLYKDISRRLQIIQQRNCGRDDRDYNITECFLPASHFGLAEKQSLNSLIPPPPSSLCPMSIDECTEWFESAGDDGIYAILGCRRTIGTVQSSSSSSYLLPPTIPQLLAASQKLYKPATKSSLTVSARALAKHAHRGRERFFGVLEGSETQKNEHADKVIRQLISEAMWINIHCFGGVDESNPVIESRTYEGYGARWSGIWKTGENSDHEDVFMPPMDVEFRGFLEPQVSICW